jgi:hypothetical protein
MYHIEAHLLCKSSDEPAAKRGMLQLPQKTSSSWNVRPQTLQFGARELTIGVGSDSGVEGDEKAESCAGLL